jgi:hypothetical protein
VLASTVPWLLVLDVVLLVAGSRLLLRSLPLERIGLVLEAAAGSATEGMKARGPSGLLQAWYATGTGGC